MSAVRLAHSTQNNLYYVALIEMKKIKDYVTE